MTQRPCQGLTTASKGDTVPPSGFQNHSTLTPHLHTHQHKGVPIRCIYCFQFLVFSTVEMFPRLLQGYGGCVESCCHNSYLGQMQQNRIPADVLQSATFVFGLWCNEGERTKLDTRLVLVLFLFYVYECFACMYVYIPSMCPVSMETREGHQIPWNGVTAFSCLVHAENPTRTSVRSTKYF